MLVTPFDPTAHVGVAPTTPSDGVAVEAPYFLVTGTGTLYLYVEANWIVAATITATQAGGVCFHATRAALLGLGTDVQGTWITNP